MSTTAVSATANPVDPTVFAAGPTKVNKEGSNDNGNNKDENWADFESASFD